MTPGPATYRFPRLRSFTASDFDVEFFCPECVVWAFWHTLAEFGISGVFWGVGDSGEDFQVTSRRKCKGGVANRPSPQSPKGILGSPPPLAYEVQAPGHS